MYQMCYLQSKVHHNISRVSQIRMVRRTFYKVYSILGVHGQLRGMRNDCDILTYLIWHTMQLWALLLRDLEKLLVNASMNIWERCFDVKSLLGRHLSQFWKIQWTLDESRWSYVKYIRKGLWICCIILAILKMNIYHIDNKYM